MSTATVETLTAEVRVLMVGNRQITLSVYRQLDSVKAAAIEPFGRVRSGRKYYGRYSEELAGVEVVGVIRAGYIGAGSLARAFAELPTEWSQLPLIVLAGLR